MTGVRQSRFAYLLSFGLDPMQQAVGLSVCFLVVPPSDSGDGTARRLHGETATEQVGSDVQGAGIGIRVRHGGSPGRRTSSGPHHREGEPCAVRWPGVRTVGGKGKLPPAARHCFALFCAGSRRQSSEVEAAVRRVLESLHNTGKVEADPPVGCGFSGGSTVWPGSGSRAGGAGAIWGISCPCQRWSPPQSARLGPRERVPASSFLLACPNPKPVFVSFLSNRLFVSSWSVLSLPPTTTKRQTPVPIRDNTSSSDLSNSFFSYHHPTSTMPTKGHHRSRSSIDRVIDLLADLEETQITLLLDDLNHTTSSNVPVSDAIALFEQHAGKPKRRSCRSPSPMRTLQVELERRHSKRMSSAPEPRSRSKIAVSQSPPSRKPAASPPPALVPAPAPTPAPAPVTPLFDRPSHVDRRPSLILSAPVPVERPRTSSAPSRSFGPRSYQRVNRPAVLSPTATAELHLLLLAFFNETPVSPATTATPSPTTPLFGFSHSPFSDLDSEPSTPGFDLLEPSPIRTPSLAPPGRRLRTMPSISSIFEGLRY